MRAIVLSILFATASTAAIAEQVPVSCQRAPCAASEAACTAECTPPPYPAQRSSNTNIVMSGGGPGTSATGFQFSLKNIDTL